MAEVNVPPELRRFILAAVPSVPHLEALLLVHGRPEGWTTAELAARLYTGEREVAKLLADLDHQGLVHVHEHRIAYAASDDLQRRIDELATFYSRHVVAVSDLIHSATDRKAHHFADAFRLRKESP